MGKSALFIKLCYCFYGFLNRILRPLLAWKLAGTVSKKQLTEKLSVNCIKNPDFISIRKHAKDCEITEYLWTY